MKRIAKNSKGFTLIELMIVVAIIGILAAIAIPNFLRYQLKSKTAEAKTNIGAIKTSQEAFRAERDYYAACTANPAAVSTAGAKQVWGTPAAGAGWEEIGYRPSSDVYYVYEVAIAGTNPAAAIAGIAAGNLGSQWGVSAIADLDTNGTNGEYGYSTDADSDGTVDVPGPGGVIGTISKAGTVEDLVPGEF